MCAVPDNLAANRCRFAFFGQGEPMAHDTQMPAGGCPPDPPPPMDEAIANDRMSDDGAPPVPD
jgi:hypothetical protein